MRLSPSNQSATSMPEYQTKKLSALQNGFSLCEVMVASAVMAVSLLGLSQLLVVSLTQNQMTRYNGMAVELGRGKVEELKTLYVRELLSGTAEADLTTGGHGPETVTLVNGVVGYSDHNFSVRWTVSAEGPVRKNLAVFVVPAGLTSPENVRPRVAKTVRFDTALLP